MRRATPMVAAAVVLLSVVPFPGAVGQATLLAAAAVAITAVVLRDYGRVAAVATLVAFTSSAVVLVGGLTAARPAAGSLPTAGVIWWWPVAVGGLITARLSLEIQSYSRAALRWLAAFLATVVAAYLFAGRAADVARALSLAPLGALVGIAVAAFTDTRSRSWWRGPALLASLAATAAWQVWIVRAVPLAARIVVPLLATSTLVLFVDALSDEDASIDRQTAPSIAAVVIALGALGLAPGLHALFDALTHAAAPAAQVLEARGGRLDNADGVHPWP
jgi:hypothetical protein